MSTNLRNIFGTVVHDVPDGTTPVELRQTFGTVVHDVPAGTTPVELRQTFATVVHDVPTAANMLKLYLNITEIAWIYKDDSPGGGGSGGGGLPPLKPLGSGGPMISSDYTINSFKALSAERVRRVDQVPFRLARKDRLGVRKLIITGSTPPEPPTGDDIRIYGNITEIAWIYKE
jgi:hypothetical protein